MTRVCEAKGIFTRFFVLYYNIPFKVGARWSSLCNIRRAWLFVNLVQTSDLEAPAID